MGHHFADGVDVGAVGHEQGREGMAKAMKGHLLGDTGILQPFLERSAGITMPNPDSYQRLANVCVLSFIAQ